jgi:hypothetical protein
MKTKEFTKLLKQHLLPFLPGAKVGKSQPSAIRHALVAYQNPCSLLLKPSETSKYRIQLLRSQPFSREERTLVQVFIEEATSLLPQSNEDFFPDLMRSLPRRVIARFLPSSRGRMALDYSIQQLEKLAAQTYEGGPITTAIGITGSIGYGPITLDELWSEDFSSVLSNGFDTMYVSGSDGRLFGFGALPGQTGVSYTPYRFGSIANWCNKTNRVALVLNRNGEILIFKHKRLQFAKRRGTWRYYSHDPVVRILGRSMGRSLKRAVYETCLDVSFAHTGGCLAVLSAASKRTIAKSVKADDLLHPPVKIRTRLLEFVIRKQFHQLDRRMRQELLAMDGATVLSRDGTVLTAGAIVRVPGGSLGGGRRAAAHQLSKVGFGIKISSDGPVTGFRYVKEVFAF